MEEAGVHQLCIDCLSHQVSSDEDQMEMMMEWSSHLEDEDSTFRTDHSPMTLTTIQYCIVV